MPYLLLIVIFSFIINKTNATPIESVTITDNNTLSINGANIETGVGNNLNGNDFITLTIDNNDVDGYDIDITASNGKLLMDGKNLGEKEGSEIDYLFSCDSFTDEANNTISALPNTDLIANTSQEIYSHSQPQDETINQRPNCNLTTTDDEDEKFAGIYKETFTITMTSD